MTIHKYLRKELLFFLSCFLSALFILSGCQKQPDLLFGSTYTDDNTGANIVVVDKATINMSTVYVDSTAPPPTVFPQVGSYNDVWLEKFTTRAYLQVAPPASLPAL